MKVVNIIRLAVTNNSFFVLGTGLKSEYYCCYSWNANEVTATNVASTTNTTNTTNYSDPTTNTTNDRNSTNSASTTNATKDA